MFNLETSMIDKLDDYNVMTAWKWYYVFYQTTLIFQMSLFIMAYFTWPLQKIVNVVSNQKYEGEQEVGDEEADLIPGRFCVPLICLLLEMFLNVQPFTDRVFFAFNIVPASIYCIATVFVEDLEGVTMNSLDIRIPLGETGFFLPVYVLCLIAVQVGIFKGLKKLSYKTIAFLGYPYDKILTQIEEKVDQSKQETKKLIGPEDNVLHNLELSQIYDDKGPEAKNLE